MAEAYSHADLIQFYAVRVCPGLPRPFMVGSEVFTLPELSQLGDHLVADLLWSLVEGTAPE